jgi:hypothetical protein
VHERSDHRSVGVSHLQTCAAMGTEQRCRQAALLRQAPVSLPLVRPGEAIAPGHAVLLPKELGRGE